jgi:hypothetical protein
MSSKPKPKLHDDILILMVEKMFFQEPQGVGDKAIDLRMENPYTFFMVSFYAKGREHECILKIYIEPIYELSEWDLGEILFFYHDHNLISIN